MNTIEQLLADAEAILTRAEAENRDLDDTERAEYDALLVRAEAAARVERIRAAAQNPANVEDGTRGQNAQLLQRTDPWAADAPLSRSSSPDLRSRALTAVERAPGGMPDAASEHITRVLQDDPDPDSRLARYVIEASQPEYFRAFAAWMRNPEHGHLEWSPEQRDAYARVQSMSRAMSIGTTTAGGFLVPYALDPQVLISGSGSIDPMREVARVELTAANDQRFVTSAGVTASWDAEGAEVSDDTPTLAQPSISSFKGQAFIPVSFELFEDSTIGAQVGALFTDAKAQLEANAFTLGTGSAQPKGVITAIAAVGGSVVTSAGSALAVADIVANQNALPARWRPRALFMANLAMINQARQLPKGSGLTASAVDDTTNPPRCYGWDLRENSSIDGTIAAGTTNDYVWLSGDFKQYIVVDRIGTMVEFIPTLFGANGRPSGQRGFHMHWRTGGDVVVTDAFRLTNFSA
jgi:HK97 family phage major capsid protein